MTCSTSCQICGKREAILEKGGDRDFIGGVQNRREGAARFAGAASEIERGEIVVTRSREFEAAELAEIERRGGNSGRAPAR